MGENAEDIINGVVDPETGEWNEKPQREKLLIDTKRFKLVVWNHWTWWPYGYRCDDGFWCVYFGCFAMSGGG